MGLDEVLQRADVWRGDNAPPISGLPSGFAALDALLPGGGWPRAALTEILVDQTGIGELKLLLPTLARLTHQDRWVVFIAPPYIPYAPALVRMGINLSHVLVIHPRAGKDTLWAVEQTLRAGTCGAVLAWPSAADDKSLRRLQLAAETGGTLGVLFRRIDVEREHSPAALRIKLEPRREAGQLGVQILKRRGGWPAGPVTLDMTANEFGEVNRAVVMHTSAAARARNLHARGRYAPPLGNQSGDRARATRPPR